VSVLNALFFVLLGITIGAFIWVPLTIRHYDRQQEDRVRRLEKALRNQGRW